MHELAVLSSTSCSPVSGYRAFLCTCTDTVQCFHCLHACGFTQQQVPFDRLGTYLRPGTYLRTPLSHRCQVRTYAHVFRVYGHVLSHVRTYVQLFSCLRAPFFTPTHLRTAFSCRYVPTYTFFRAYGHVFSHLRTYVQLFSCLRAPFFTPTYLRTALSYWYVPTYTFFRAYGHLVSLLLNLRAGSQYLRTRFLHSLTLVPSFYAHVFTCPPSYFYTHLPFHDVFFQPSPFTIFDTGFQAKYFTFL